MYYENGKEWDECHGMYTHAETVTMVEEVVVEEALDEGGGALSEVDELE